MRLKALMTTITVGVLAVAMALPVAAQSATFTDKRGDAVVVKGSGADPIDITKVAVTYTKKSLVVTATLADVTVDNWSMARLAIDDGTLPFRGGYQLSAERKDDGLWLGLSDNSGYSGGVSSFSAREKLGAGGSITFTVPSMLIGKPAWVRVAVTVEKSNPSTAAIVSSDRFPQLGSAPMAWSKPISRAAKAKFTQVKTTVTLSKKSIHPNGRSTMIIRTSPEVNGYVTVRDRLNSTIGTVMIVNGAGKYVVKQSKKGKYTYSVLLTPLVKRMIGAPSNSVTLTVRK